jgi:hypothetical protein
VITYSQTFQTVLVSVVLQPRAKKCSISSAVCRGPVFDGGPRSSGVVALVEASDDTVGGRLAEEGANGEAVDSLDDSCLSTLSKSKSSPECESESSGCRGRGRGGAASFVRLHSFGTHQHDHIHQYPTEFQCAMR